jgi:ABC-type transport system involved in multi-copper enzyme maturation permease subunit
MSVLTDLFVDNPMLMEAKRFMRRFIGIRAGAAHVVILVMVVVAYVLLLGLIATTRDVPPEAIVMIQTGLYCLVMPPMLQGCIAGEREKGTWESLLAAPVSKAQIVVGKYWGAFLAVLALTALMLPPLIWANAGGSQWMNPYEINYYERHTMPASRLFSMELVSVTFGLMLAAWCVLVSARSRRSFSAQGMIFGSLILGLILWPIFIGVLVNDAQGPYAVLNCLHPFFVIDALSASGASEYASAREIAAAGGGSAAIIAYSFLTFAFLIWADRTLRFAESDVRFMPRRKRASNR